MSHQSDLIASDIQEYLRRHEQKEILRFLTCGSVDDGKSTLIGRLLFDTSMIAEDQMTAVESDSKRLGTQGEKIDLALLVDGLAAEREQGITIDVAYRYFSTESRKYIIADTPGHEQYTRNMATGASNCDLAIILIDAREGVLTQTRRHTYIANLLGIKHLVVAVNKMDLMGFSQERFEEIRRQYLDFAEPLDLGDVKFVPMSALDGDNVVNRSTQCDWYTGPTLMEVLETVQVANDRNMNDFRLPVQYVNRPNLDFRGFSGTIASGIIKPGDRVKVLPSGLESDVDRIVTFDGDLDKGFASQAVTLTLKDEIDISRGDMLVKVGDNISVSSRLNANIVWMAEQAMKPGKQYMVKFASAKVTGSFSVINHRVDINTLEQHQAGELALNEIGSCELSLTQPVAFDPYSNNRQTGAFIVIDRLTNATVAAGMVEGQVDSSRKLEPVSETERASRLGHKSATVLVSSELSLDQVERELFDAGVLAVQLADGSKRLASQAAVLNKAGLIVLVDQVNSGSLVDQSLYSLKQLNELPQLIKELTV